MGSVNLKVINIKSEVLFRSAEDDFFYFNKINSAYKKLKEAVALTPNHLKSLLLLADITFIKGNIKKALDLYREAEKISDWNVKVLASVANCYYRLKDYSLALEYCDKTLSKLNTQKYSLFSQVFEMKINILTEQKQYEQAYNVWKSAKNIFNEDYLKTLYRINYEILNEKINLQKKLQKSNLKIV